jgi:hypothetical protein
MTLAERLAQLGSVWASSLVGERGNCPERQNELVPAGIGEIARSLGSTDLRAGDAAGVANSLQRHLVEVTRQAIPAVIHKM